MLDNFKADDLYKKEFDNKTTYELIRYLCQEENYSNRVADLIFCMSGSECISKFLIAEYSVSTFGDYLENLKQNYIIISLDDHTIFEIGRRDEIEKIYRNCYDYASYEIRKVTDFKR